MATRDKNSGQDDSTKPETDEAATAFFGAKRFVRIAAVQNDPGDSH